MESSKNSFGRTRSNFGTVQRAHKPKISGENRMKVDRKFWKRIRMHSVVAIR